LNERTLAASSTVAMAQEQRLAPHVFEADPLSMIPRAMVTNQRPGTA
jgi:hypothetical protein